MTRVKLLACMALILIITSTVEAAPTKQDLAAVSRVFDDNAADDLAALKMCGKPELYYQYLNSMSDAGALYPQRDPQKMRALIRQIQRRGDSLASMRTRFNESSKQDVIDEDCKFDTGQALKHLKILDDFIFKS
ncbi:hypothetical protein K0038_04182 [Pseudomonas syringae]|uniref:hypothetical protein n=1 Tax=Pseudomonas syringae TaxID=317 RepID=UPI001CA9C70C|nr:hypothetical protein [Pseudomonas syringae]MCI3947094.1 hypothetical protein [Pseudomonas syringae]